MTAQIITHFQKKKKFASSGYKHVHYSMKKNMKKTEINHIHSMYSSWNEYDEYNSIAHNWTKNICFVVSHTRSLPNITDKGRTLMQLIKDVCFCFFPPFTWMKLRHCNVASPLLNECTLPGDVMAGKENYFTHHLTTKVSNPSMLCVKT